MVESIFAPTAPSLSAADPSELVELRRRDRERTEGRLSELERRCDMLQSARDDAAVLVASLIERIVAHEAAAADKAGKGGKEPEPAAIEPPAAPVAKEPGRVHTDSKGRRWI